MQATAESNEHRSNPEADGQYLVELRVQCK